MVVFIASPSACRKIAYLPRMLENPSGKPRKMTKLAASPATKLEKSDESFEIRCGC